MTASIVLGTLVALVGSGGIVFAALRYNRDETGKTVSQQSQILTDMRGLIDELQEELERVRVERDTLIERVKEQTARIEQLSVLIDDLDFKLKRFERECP